MENTKVIYANGEGIREAAELIVRGEVVGMPTETVYGLAADAQNSDAVAKIFKAKGRPQDNPLIVHISSFEMLFDVAARVPDEAMRLAKLFWPGPLTIILPKSDRIPLSVTAGLDTVGIRMPSHKAARALIEVSGKPIAAPSANTSGKPSPTTAEHVLCDMNGKIPLILDGGACEFGVESTVVQVKDNGTVVLFRPGFVTLEELLENGFRVEVSDGVFEKLPENEKALSPGLKHRHYSPKARVVIVDGSDCDFSEFADSHSGEGVYFLTYGHEDIAYPHLCYGETAKEQANELFDRLREFDETGAKIIYARPPEKTGVGTAVYNRLLRAAGFEVIKLGQK